VGAQGGMEMLSGSSYVLMSYWSSGSSGLNNNGHRGHSTAHTRCNFPEALRGAVGGASVTVPQPTTISTCATSIGQQSRSDPSWSTTSQHESTIRPDPLAPRLLCSRPTPKLNHQRYGEHLHRARAGPGACTRSACSEKFCAPHASTPHASTPALEAHIGAAQT
jgi:hypothetical protein